jgi:hypothetical protein
MLSQGQEVAALDFADIIGGPLVAVINAQAKAANVTASFIQQMAFTQGTGADETALKTVTFDFSQMLGSDTTTMGAGSTIRVPLLSLLPIPFIRVDSMSLHFNVNLHRTDTTTITNDLTGKVDTTEKESAGLGKWSESATFTASVTEKNTFQNNQVLDDTYSMDVTVHAVQDQMPGGLAQVLSIFENLIQAQATMLQAQLTAQGQQPQLNAPRPLAAPSLSAPRAAAPA